MFWSTDTIVLKNERRDLVSEYRTGQTDTLGVYETLTLIDCAGSHYQGYTIVRHSETGAATGGAVAVRANGRDLSDGLEGLRASAGGLTFETLAELAAELGADKPDYGSDVFADQTKLTTLCSYFGHAAGGWKAR
jgi:hypothetical protein